MDEVQNLKDLLWRAVTTMQRLNGLTRGDELDRLVCMTVIRAAIGNKPDVQTVEDVLAEIMAQATPIHQIADSLLAEKVISCSPSEMPAIWSIRTPTSVMLVRYATELEIYQYPETSRPVQHPIMVALQPAVEVEKVNEPA